MPSDAESPPARRLRRDEQREGRDEAANEGRVGKGREVVMAMPQRDDTIEEIKRLDALLEYAVMHGDEVEAARLRAALRKITDEV